MKILRSMLLKRQKHNELINVAIVGSGWFGSGVIREFYRWPGLFPRLAVTRTIEKAVKSLRHAGASASEIAVIDSHKEYRQAIADRKYVVTSNIEIMKDLKGIDIVFEATGDVEAGAEMACYTIQQGKDYITANIEMDGTVGFAVDRLAKENGVIYSTCDGDQPGVLSRMIDEIKLYGFEIIVAGSCKGFVDVYQTPAGVLPWVRPGHNPRMISAFADGTKQSLEMSVLANGMDLTPDVRGMHGPTTTKTALIEDFLKIIKREGIVDYVMGITGVDQGAGVFVVAKRDDEFVAKDMDYLKKGKGPYYLFFRDHHFCYYEAAKSVVEAVLFKVPTLLHEKKTSDVLAIAKKDLKTGERLDGIGGFTVYGVIDKVEAVHNSNLLPVGLSSYAVTEKNIEQDAPITYDLIDFPEDNIAIQLRKTEEKIIAEECVNKDIRMVDEVGV